MATSVHSWDYGGWLCGWSRDGKWLLLIDGGSTGIARLRTPDGKPGPEIEEADVLAELHLGYP
jgi:hypothetical protein